jgi:hypothetical protein
VSVKTKPLPASFYTWADVLLLAALFGYSVEQRSLRSATFVNREGDFPLRTEVKLSPNGWRGWIGSRIGEYSRVR